MPSPKNISITDYTYQLPDERIALHPLPERDQSKLLVWKNGIIHEDHFKNIVDYSPSESLLVFNNSKVINARIRFEKTTGSVIEIFCLEPAGDFTDYGLVMQQNTQCLWKCFIGGVAKWKTDFLIKNCTINGKSVELKARIVEKLNDAYIVAFEWTPSSVSFAELLMAVGEIPLPPYIKRTIETADHGRYQTVYAKHDGSVAAPTAGLHFTPSILHHLKNKNITQAQVTLHVGAGTFKPVKSATMGEHEMHSEWIDVDLNTIESILLNKGLTIAVGTTSLRTLESLYWLGVKCIIDSKSENLSLLQWDAYLLAEHNVDRETALNALLNWMQLHNKNRIFTTTQLLIAPGYQFRIAKALVTNFHQPQSTLLLLVAAAIGDEWKKCYDYALANDFRFLSYGDASLIFMAES